MSRNLMKARAWTHWYHLAKMLPRRVEFSLNLPAKRNTHPLALNAAWGRVRYWTGDPPPPGTVAFVAFVREACRANDDRFGGSRALEGYMNRRVRRHVAARPVIAHLIERAAEIQIAA